MAHAVLKTDCYNEANGRPIIFDNKFKLIEYDQEVINLAKRSNMTLDIIQGDIRQLPFGHDSFEVILDLSTLDHIPPKDVATVIGEYNRVLGPRGKLLLITWLTNNEAPEKEWTPQDQYFFKYETVKKELDKYFDTTEESLLFGRADPVYKEGFLYEFVCSKKDVPVVDGLTMYTCITGEYDELKKIPYGIKAIAYLDSPCSNPDKWQVKNINRLTLSNTREARMRKCLSHLYTDTEWSLWVDGCVELRIDPKKIIKKYSKRGDIIMFQSRNYNSVIKEGELILKSGLDSCEVVNEQLNTYLEDRHFNPNVLSTTMVVLRKHTPKVIEFNNMWWSQICRYSLRDQLSVDYCAQKVGLKIGYFDKNIYESKEFVRKEHQQERGVGEKY